MLVDYEFLWRGRALNGMRTCADNYQEEDGAAGAQHRNTSALPVPQPQGVAAQTLVDHSCHRHVVFRLSLSLPPFDFTDLKTVKSSSH